MNYTQAQEILAKGRNKDSRTIANNTRVIRRGECIAIQLHQTDILTIWPDNRVLLDVGQWRTVTSKARLNEYLPSGWRITQTKNVWYLVRRRRDNPGEIAQEYVYQNGITIAQDGTVQGAVSALACCTREGD